MEKKKNWILMFLCLLIWLALLITTVVLFIKKLIPSGAGIIAFVFLLLIAMVGFFMTRKKIVRQKNIGEPERPALGLIMQIRTSLDNLVLKTNALPEKNYSEKRRIETLDESVNQMEPVATIDAAKLEQEILMNVTQISSLCDSVIAGSDDESFKKALSILENQIRERKLKAPSQ